MAGEARRRRRYIAGGGQHEGDQGHSSHSCTAAWRAHPCAKGTAAQKTTQVRRNESRRWAMKDDETQRRARIGNSGTTTRAELNECYIGVTTDWNPDPVNQRDRPISNSFLHPPALSGWLLARTYVHAFVTRAGLNPTSPILWRMETWERSDFSRQKHGKGERQQDYTTVRLLSCTVTLDYCSAGFYIRLKDDTPAF